MKSSRSTILASAAVALLSISASPLAPRALAQNTCKMQPDNSAANKNQSTTADNQTNAKADRMTTAQVRRAIMHDKDLSTYGHNVKIIVSDGNVTLKGPVKTDDEKSKVAADAASVVSPDRITNQVTVKQ